MKILSLNVRGLGMREKRSKVKKLVSNLKVDMLLLQETKLKDLKPIILQSIRGISEVDSVHVDANGSADGLITLWSPEFFRLMIGIGAQSPSNFSMLGYLIPSVSG